MACRRTVDRSALRRIQYIPPIDNTYQQPQPPFLARFFRSWDGHSIYIIINNSLQARRGIAYCFGAVVLTYRCTSHQQPPTRPLRITENHTLKATGVWLAFLILRTCDTSVVKGPVHIHQPSSTQIRKSTYAGTPAPGDRFRPTYLVVVVLSRMRSADGSLCKLDVNKVFVIWQPRSGSWYSTKIRSRRRRRSNSQRAGVSCCWRRVAARGGNSCVIV